MGTSLPDAGPPPAAVRTVPGDRVEDPAAGQPPAAAPRLRPAGLRDRLPDFGRIAAVSASLVGTTAFTSVLGLVYWTVAARQTSVAAVGLAGAAVSLMMLLGNVGMLGLGTLLIAEVPRTDLGRRRLLVRTSLLVSGVASAVLGLLAVLVVRLLHVHGLQEIGSPFNTLDFAAGTALLGLTTVLDQAVLAVGSGRLQLERNVVSSAAKIVFLVLLTAAGRRSGMDIFLAWTLGNLVSLPLVAHRTRGGRQHQQSRRLVDLDVLRGLARAAAGHHVLNLVLQAPLQLLSLVVVVVLSAESNGFFSTARSVSGFVFVLPFSITIGLFAAAGGDEREVIRRMSLTVPLCLAASLAAVVALFPLGGPVLSVFGSEYSTEGLTTLRVLVLAGLPFVIKDHFVALRRVQGRTGSAAAAAAAGAVLEVVAAVVGARVGGLVGLCGFWVGALVLEALLLALPLRRAVLALRAEDAASGGAPAPDELAAPTPAQAAVLGSAMARSPDELDGSAMHMTMPAPAAPAPAAPAAPEVVHPAPVAVRRRLPVPSAGPVVAVMCLGLVLIAWAVARGRDLDPLMPTAWIYWAGYLVVLLPAAAAILSPRTRPRDRLLVSLALPVVLQLSREVLYPTRFMFHDELIHANGLRLLDVTHHLFATNSLLPVTEYYPGLEVAAQGVQQLTGLPAHAAAAVVLVLARVLLAGSIVAVVQRVSGSLRIGCLASLVYTCNSQAIFFNSQFSYQTLALPLALFTVHLFTARRRDGSGGGRALVLPLLALAATIVTHHLTSMLLVAAFGIWWLLELVLSPRKSPRKTSRKTPREGSRDRRDLGVMTVAGAAMAAGWALLPGNTLLSYLDAIVVSSVTEVVKLLTGQTTRTLFTSSSGQENPLWERVVSIAAVLLVVAALLPALWRCRTWFRQRRALAVLLCLVGAAYPLIPAGHITVTTAEVTDRSAGFLFLGVGFVLAYWLVSRRPGRLPATPLLLPALAVLFVGDVILGAGTTSAQLPGPFLVSADARSIDAQNLAAADWLRQHSPEGTRVFADRVAGLLAAAEGGQHTVTHIGDDIDASRILLAPTFTEADRQLIARAGISYVVVDERDATGLPNQEVYIESGEYGEDSRRGPVPLEALRKLLGVPGVNRVYDNGALVVYDVRVLGGR